MSIAEPPPMRRDVSETDDEPLFEVINGKMVELEPMAFHSTKLASKLVRKIGAFADAYGLGEVVAETLFRLPIEEDPQRNRRPDVAFVSYKRWPKDKPESILQNAWDVVPDLAIEVISPSDRAQEMLEKVGEFLRAGVRQVWVVYPKPGVIFIHELDKPVTSVGPTGVLDGGPVLPGLQLSLAEVFVFPTIDERVNTDDE
jgi:Uma2 family endonuclease